MDAYHTASYKLEVMEQDGKHIYQVRNKDTGVIEYEDFLLSRILDTLVEMQSRLDAAVEKYSTYASPPSAPQLTVIPGGTGDGEGGVH